MSSGPVGLDVREYVYQIFTLPITDGSKTYAISAQKNWMVTKIQFFAGANPGTFTINPELTALTIAANGCLILEPNGAFRDTITVTGLSCLLIVEYWFKANAFGDIAIQETVTP